MDDRKPGMQHWRHHVITMLVSAVLIVIVALTLAGCSDAAGPTPPDSLRPEFQKVYQGAGSGGHGGGASGGSMVCEYPKHWSAECASKRAKAQGTAYTSGQACWQSGWNVVVCTGGGVATGIAWEDYHETPGSDGIPYDPDPVYGPNEGPTSYPACQFQCWVRGNMPPEAGGYNW